MTFLIALLINLLAFALVALIVLWIFDMIAKAFGAPPQIYAIIKAIILLILLLAFLNAMFAGGWTFYPIHR